MVLRGLLRIAVMLGAGFGAAAAARDDGSSLIPAGSINSVFVHDAIVIIHEDEPVVRRHAELIASKFFPRAVVMTTDEAEETDLTGKNLIVYGSADCAWLERLSPRLPFRFGDDQVELQGRTFAGDHLRVICAIKSPLDPTRKAVIYAAADAGDVAEINSVHHGPTEWVVADGARTLAKGSFQVELTRLQLAQDLDYLVDKIEAVHVAAVKRLPDAVHNEVDHVREAIEGPMSRREFGFLVVDILIALKDSHSTIETGDDGAAIDLPVRWIDEGLIVTDDTRVLKRGDRIQQLGGVAPDALLAGLERLVPAENAWWVRHQGARRLAESAVLKELGIDTEHVTARIERGGETTDVVVPPGTPQRAEERGGHPWARYRIDTVESLGIFTLDQCRFDEEYRTRLHQFFEAVHDNEIARVAVDLRRNSGGNSAVVNEFIRYLDVDEYRDFHGEIRVSQESIEQSRYERPLGLYAEGPVSRTNDRIDDLPPFRGELYVLTSNQTFSSGTWFAVVIQDNDLGEIVGEPTGSSPSGYGDLLKFTLPHSEIEFSLSHKRFIRPAPERDPASTVMPDHPVPLTRRDIIDRTDPVIAYLESLEPAAPEDG